jgi:uncharacterized damage-inducible protein DinB
MIWTAPPTERVAPGTFLVEREAYEAWLAYHRSTLLGKCSGLSAGQLRRRAVPSSQLSLLGLVRHLTDVERWWFRVYATGQWLPLPYRPADNRDAAFTGVDGADAEAALSGYRAEIAAADAAVRDLDLDHELDLAGLVAAGVPVPEPFRPPRSLRWVYLHMIEEYARHNGHADLLREAIDGTTGE